MEPFDAFYHTHVRFVYAIALARGATRCEAEDLTQEAFLRAWEHFGMVCHFEAPSQRAWLRRVLCNLATDAWRRNRASVAVADALHSSAETPEEDPALRLDVMRALGTLDPQDREIAVLRYFLQMNSREVGELLQIPESTIRRKLADCRRHLARQLRVWDEETEDE